MSEEQAADGQNDLPTMPEDLLAQLDALGVAYALHHHEAVFTVEESAKVDRQIAGLHCRNLFLRDKKKKMFLVVLPNTVQVDMKKLAPVIGADRLSFGSESRLWEHLGVRPGSVCPFSIINDTQKQVKIILDKGMMDAPHVNYHPLLNNMTVTITPAGLLTFIEECGHAPEIIDLTAAAP